MSTRAGLDGCDIRVRLKIAFQNSSNLTGQPWTDEIQRCMDAIESVWNGPRKYGACPVEYEVWTVDNGGSEVAPAEHHLVEIFPYGQLPADAPYEAFANVQTEGAYAYWQAGHSDLIIAHEAGHLMALDDEYALSIEGGSTVPAGFDEDPPSLMASVDPGAEPKSRHVDSLMQTLQVLCPVFCGFRGLRWMARIWRPPSAKWEIAARRIRFLSPPLPPLQNLKAVLDLLRTETRPALVHRATLVLVKLAHADPQPLLTALDRERKTLLRWALVLALSQVKADAVTARLVRIARDSAEDELVRVEAARGLLLRGRREGVPVLLEGLRSRRRTLTHPPRTVRFYCSETLRNLLTGEDFGFDAAKNEDARERARKAFEDWWASH